MQTSWAFKTFINYLCPHSVCLPESLTVVSHFRVLVVFLTSVMSLVVPTTLAFVNFQISKDGEAAIIVPQIGSRYKGPQ